MKKFLILAAVACLGVMAAAVSASAAKPSGEAKAAKALCVDQKQADKAAFKATYGKNAMRNCKRDARDTVAEATRNAAQECRAEQQADPDGFQTTHGSNRNGKNAFGKCVSSKRSDELDEEVEEFDNAAQQCRAERNADPDGFQETHGTNSNKKNAFGKCVSSKVSENDDDEETTEPTE